MGLRVIGLHLQNGAVQLLGFAQPACPVMGDGLLLGGVERLGLGRGCGHEKYSSGPGRARRRGRLYLGRNRLGPPGDATTPVFIQIGIPCFLALLARNGGKECVLYFRSMYPDATGLEFAVSGVTSS